MIFPFRRRMSPAQPSVQLNRLSRRSWWSVSVLVVLLLSSVIVFANREPVAHAQTSSTIAINAGTTYQTIDGFGTAEVAPWSDTLYSMSSTQQQHSGSYLSLQGNSASDGTQVNQWHWLNAISQAWTFYPDLT